jgi:P27 family predicted phage terminase small subunit
MKKSTLTIIDQAETAIDFTPPKAVPKEMHQHYVDICEHLSTTGRFHQTDHLLVAEYLISLHEAGKARAMYLKEGLMIEATQGMKAHPMVAVANQCRCTATKIAASLGLAPAHRHRMSLTLDDTSKGKTTENPWKKSAGVK